jgi:hypothetical protein
VRAGLLPAESKRIGLTNAQASLAKSNAANVDVTTAWMPKLNQSTIDYNRAQIGNIGAETDFTRARTTTAQQGNSMNLDLSEYLKGLAPAARAQVIGQSFRFGL